jgi:hypothetical protein
LQVFHPQSGWCEAELSGVYQYCITVLLKVKKTFFAGQMPALLKRNNGKSFTQKAAAVIFGPVAKLLTRFLCLWLYKCASA